ncbi:hypothetical protein SASPL_121678 [Salvia splendens]|uniref:Protein kinase domain-containing protein n=1 Tax=Salvia splendens TaxID=180675 RepID=A0A8X8ZWS6_SALSN|nr:hypothetical protein SASPL_121678 [Salvia splendens]
MKQNRPLQEHEERLSDSLGSNAKHSTGQTKEDRPQGSGIHGVTKEMVSTWNRALGLPIFHNKPLVPFEEWNIDFSELTVGTRIGIVILFLGACMKPPRLSLITEYMEMGSLYYLIHLSGQKNKLSWRRRIKMLRDICRSNLMTEEVLNQFSPALATRGLMCIHRMKIIHHDLKSANCLVSKHWTVKICDFGLSRIMTDAPIKSSSGGTLEWMAPEVIRNEPFTEKCDIFSLSVIIWELYTLHRPWDGMPPERVVHAVANEGLRLEMPQGLVGRLIAGMSHVEDLRALANGNTSALRTILCVPCEVHLSAYGLQRLCIFVDSDHLNTVVADCWAEPHARPSCEEILARLLDCESQP